MDNVYLFYHNSHLKAVFNDNKTMKEKIFHHVLEYYVDQQNYNNKKEAGLKLRDKLRLLFKEGFYFLEAHNSVWSIVKVGLNGIQPIIKNNSYQTIYTKINVKGRKCTKKDLYRDLSFLEVESLYSK